MNIVLIGYRGTGKTSVGRALAERLGRPFYDADAFLEEKFGQTIKEMVSAEGWPFFREREKEVIAELSGFDDVVIASGGGAVMDEDNVVCLSRDGFLVLLTADMETLIRRIQGDVASGEQRPGLTGDDIYEETRAMIELRMPVYERVAHMAVDTTRLGIHEVVGTVIREGLKGLV